MSLRILFGINEIADAFLTNNETITKRLFRAREKLRSAKVAVRFPCNFEITKRLETVVLTLYLVYSEVYCSEYRNSVIRGNTISRYQLEASIAYWHTVKTDNREKWNNILQLYDKLLQVVYSRLAAVDRIYALSKISGAQAAIQEAKRLNMNTNHFYFSLLGVLYKGTDPTRAKVHFEQAYSPAKTTADKKAIRQKMDSLELPD